MFFTLDWHVIPLRVSWGHPFKFPPAYSTSVCITLELVSDFYCCYSKKEMYFNFKEGIQSPHYSNKITFIIWISLSVGLTLSWGILVTLIYVRCISSPPLMSSSAFSRFCSSKNKPLRLLSKASPPVSIQRGWNRQRRFPMMRRMMFWLRILVFSQSKSPWRSACPKVFLCSVQLGYKDACHQSTELSHLNWPKGFKNVCLNSLELF